MYSLQYKVKQAPEHCYNLMHVEVLAPLFQGRHACACWEEDEASKT